MLRPYHSGARAHHLVAGCRDRVPWHQRHRIDAKSQVQCHRYDTPRPKVGAGTRAASPIRFKLPH